MSLGRGFMKLFNRGMVAVFLLCLVTVAHAQLVPIRINNGITVFVPTNSQPSNQAPVAQADQYNLFELAATNYSVLDNDTDPDSDPLTLTAIVPKSGTSPIGSVQINGTNITYTPNASYSGSYPITDIFTYTISDGKGGEAQADLTITLEPIGLDIQTNAQDSQLIINWNALSGASNYQLNWQVDGGQWQVFSGNITGTSESLPLTTTGQYTVQLSVTLGDGSTEIFTSNLQVESVRPAYESNHFANTVFVGNGASQNIETGLDYVNNQGLVWFKNLNTSNYPTLVDTVRGRTHWVASSSTDTGGTAAENLVTSFRQDGFGVGQDNNSNGNGNNMLAMQFLEKEGFFDIVTYTGTGANRTLAHSLNAEVGHVMIKNLTSSNRQWLNWHRGMSGDDYLYLSARQPKNSLHYFWNSTTPTETAISLGDSINANASGDEFVAYVFAHNPSKGIYAGSYSGSGGSGNKQTLGFKPKLLLLKSTSHNGGWHLLTSEMNSSDRWDQYIALDENSAVATMGAAVQVEEDGFSFTGTSDNWSGYEMIFLAIGDPILDVSFVNPLYDSESLIAQVELSSQLNDATNVEFSLDGINWFQATGIPHQYNFGMLAAGQHTLRVRVTREASSTEVFNTEFTIAESIVMTVAQFEWATSSISAGQNATLFWDVTNAENCYLDIDGVQTTKGASGVITQTLATEGQNTAKLHCTAADGSRLPENSSQFLEASITVSPANTNPKSNFSLTTYTGNGATNSVDVGLNLAEGGLVVVKKLTQQETNHWYWYDTERPIGKHLRSGSSGPNWDSVNATTFTNDGFTVTGGTPLYGADANLNADGESYLSLAFKEQHGVFDIVQYTGNGSRRAISHKLGAEVGMVIIKSFSKNEGGWVWHRSGDVPGTIMGMFGLGAMGTHNTIEFDGKRPSTNQFWIRDGNGNTVGEEYVAYIFAHNPAKGFNFDSYVGTGVSGTPASFPWQPELLLRKFGSRHWIANTTSLGSDKQLSFSDNNYGWLDTDESSATWTTALEADGSLNIQVQNANFGDAFNGLNNTYFTMAFSEYEHPGIPVVLPTNSYANHDNYTVLPDEPSPLSVQDNDTNPSGVNLVIDSVHSSENAEVTVYVSPNNLIRYWPVTGFCGEDTFTYTVSDGTNLIETATVTVNVDCTANNEPPVANDDAVTTQENTDIVIDVLANDSDPEGGALQVLSTVVQTGTTVKGSLQINPDNTITYLAPTEKLQTSYVDEFTYNIGDDVGQHSWAYLRVTVIPSNYAPVAMDDSVNGTEDVPITINVLANDTDQNVEDVLTVESVTVPSNGETNVETDQSISYIPNLNFCGNDTFNYQINDGKGGTDSALVTVQVTCVDDAPVLNDDVVNTPENQSIFIDVLANDSDVDSTLIIGTLSTPPNGTVINEGGTAVAYDPNSGFCGPDSFTYNVGGAAQATVTVNVTCTSPTPILQTLTWSATNNTVKIGEPVTLTWAVTNANSCRSDFSSKTTVNDSDSKVYYAAGTYNYTLTCDGVNFPAPPITVEKIAAPTINNVNGQ